MTLAEIKAQRAAKAATNNNAVTSNNAVNSDLLEGLDVLQDKTFKVIFHLDSMERVKAFRLKKQGLTLTVKPIGFVIEGITEDTQGVWIDTDSIKDYLISFKDDKECKAFIDSLHTVNLSDYNKPVAKLWNGSNNFDIELTKPYELV